MFEHTDANLIQVFEEAVEDGHQVGRCQLIPQNDRQLVDGERQRASHLPLKEGRWERARTFDAENIRSILTHRLMQLLNDLQLFSWTVM